MRPQGTAALQVRNDYRSFDQEMEGVRSLGVAQGVGSFVWPGQGMRLMLDHYWFRGCKGNWRPLLTEAPKTWRGGACACLASSNAPRGYPKIRRRRKRIKAQGGVRPLPGRCRRTLGTKYECRPLYQSGRCQPVFA